MSRRKFIAVLGGGAAVVAGDVPMVVWAQQVLARAPDELPRVILVSAGDGADPASRRSVVAFEQGLSAAGWSAGVNMRLDYRWLGADDLTKRAAAAAAEIAGLRPTVTVAVGAAVSLAMQRATSTIPIVFAVVSDPIAQGLVSQLAHPGGNITGFSLFEPGMGGKWLDLLKKMLPHTTRVAVMFNPVVSPVNELFLRTVNDAARSFDVEVTRAPVQDDTDIEAIVERLAGARNGALLVPSDAFTVFRSKMIVALATEYHLPAIYAYRRFVGDGGLVSYGVDLDEHMRSTASYVDRIIRGTKPGNLPVQQPTKYTLVINLNSAKLLGLEIPPNVLALADEVIE
jgi:putative tryptophan/tyrosine transport system substrate-binding protein